MVICKEVNLTFGIVLDWIIEQYRKPRIQHTVFIVNLTINGVKIFHSS